MGAIAKGVWGRSLPVGYRGSWGRSPSEAEAVCRHCLQILTAETNQNLKISHNMTNMTNMFYGGAKQFICWLSALADAWRRN